MRRFLPRILPEILIQPVESCDQRTVEPRAIILLDLQPLAERFAKGPLATVLAPKRKELNLFEPRPYIQHVQQLGTVEQRGELVVTTGKSLGLSMGEIAMARKMYRIMQERGLTDPFVPIGSPPARGWKGKRHLHPRYQFEPLPGFQRPDAT